MDYLRSTLYFAKKTAQYGCDVEIATHPFVDRGTDRLSVLRNICEGVPNPFVLGREGYKQYERMFTHICLEAMAAQAQVTDPLLPPPPPPPTRPRA